MLIKFTPSSHLHIFTDSPLFLFKIRYTLARHSFYQKCVTSFLWLYATILFRVSHMYLCRVHELTSPIKVAASWPLSLHFLRILLSNEGQLIYDVQLPLKYTSAIHLHLHTHKTSPRPEYQLVYKEQGVTGCRSILARVLCSRRNV